MDEKKYGSVVTVVGQAAVANAAVLGQRVNLVDFAVGDGNGSYYYPQAEMTALKHEVWRGNISQYKAAGNQIDVSTLVPSVVGGFTMREMGLFDDQNRLIAVANMPETEKIVIEDGAASELELTMVIQVSNADVVTFEIDPTVTLATKKNIEEHNDTPDAHQELFDGKADADLGNVSKESFKAFFEETGVAGPEGSVAAKDLSNVSNDAFKEAIDRTGVAGADGSLAAKDLSNVTGEALKAAIENTGVTGADGNVAAKPTVTEVTLTAESWIGEASPYRQSVVVSGVVKEAGSESLLYVAVMQESENMETATDCKVMAAELGENSVTFSAEKKPEGNVGFLVVNAGDVKIER